MKRIILGLIFSGSFLLAALVFAQNSSQSSSDSGVLVSPPIQAQEADQDNATSNSINSKHQQAASASNASSQNDTASQGQKVSKTSSQKPPQQNAIDACQDKSEGDACEMTTARGSRKGVCTYTSDKQTLFCKHSRKRSKAHG